MHKVGALCIGYDLFLQTETCTPLKKLIGLGLTQTHEIRLSLGGEKSDSTRSYVGSIGLLDDWTFFNINNYCCTEVKEVVPPRKKNERSRRKRGGEEELHEENTRIKEKKKRLDFIGSRRVGSQIDLALRT